MDEIFYMILKMSVTAAIIIPVVLLVRLALKKAPKVFAYGLWSIVLFRLLCPVSFSSDFSFMGLLRKPMGYVQESVRESVQENVWESVQENVRESMQENVQESVQENEQENAGSLLPAVIGSGEKPSERGEAIWNRTGNVFAYVWLLGVAAMLLYSVVTLGRLKYKLKSAMFVGENVYESGFVGSPFVCGVIRPRIYLPEKLEEGEKEYILLHEQTHIKRGDHITRLLAYFALSIHWFNPLVWLAFFVSGKDMELSCDEAVLRKIGDRKKAYSASLLNLATGRRVVTGIPLAFGEGNIKGRIKNVLNYKKPAFWLVIAAIVICAVSGVFLLGNPKEKEKVKNEDIAEDEKEPEAESEEVYGYGGTKWGVVREVESKGKKVKVISIPMEEDILLTEARNIVSKQGEKNPVVEIGDIVEVECAGTEYQVEDATRTPNVVRTQIGEITILARGYGIEPIDSESYRLSIPIDKVEEGNKAKAGDNLSVFLVRGFGEELQEPILEFFSKIISKEKDTITIETNRAMDYLEPDIYLCSAGKINGTYKVTLTSMDREKRWITGVGERQDSGNNETLENHLNLADNCIFKANYGMHTYRYSQISYNDFVDLIEEGNTTADVTFSNSEAVEISLRSAYESEGVFVSETPRKEWSEESDYLASFLKTATLASAEQKDVADIPGLENIEVYTNEEEGFVLVKDAKGNVIYCEDAHTTGAGWNNIYVGELMGQAFLMTATIENRFEFGGNLYHVFRFDENGEIVQIAGSKFDWIINNGVPKYAKEWYAFFDMYLENCYLVLSTQDGEIRTEKVCEAERYNYTNFYGELSKQYEEWKKANGL